MVRNENRDTDSPGPNPNTSVAGDRLMSLTIAGATASLPVSLLTELSMNSKAVWDAW